MGNEMLRKGKIAVATMGAMVVTNMILMVLESQNDLVLVSVHMENCMMIKLVIRSNIQEGWHSKVSPKRRHGNCNNVDGVAKKNVILVKNRLA
eukprot:1059923-Ditylum_brightwellii.AAC.1